MKLSPAFMKVFQRLEQACRFLNDKARIMETRYHVLRCKQASETELLEQGRLMTEEELKVFYEKLLESIHQSVVQCNATALDKDGACKFQRMLMTLLLFTAGGQRKEVIMSLTTKVMFFFECLIFFPRMWYLTRPKGVISSSWRQKKFSEE
jgi:hypothetical protein